MQVTILNDFLIVIGVQELAEELYIMGIMNAQ